jgi:catechol 2,3-dioxygenase-like lactoylglutathione lyase family enzyme
MTVMDITIHQTFLPHDDPDASLAFYRDTLGFQVRNDVGYGGMRRITVGPADQPGTSIVLEPPARWGADFWCRLSISRLAVRPNTTVHTGLI